VNFVDDVARPIRVRQLLVREQQHGAAGPPAFAQEGLALEVGGNAQNRQHV
jgi:hypothetical protein